MDQAFCGKDARKGCFDDRTRWNVGCEHRLTIGKGRVGMNDKLVYNELYTIAVSRQNLKGSTMHD